MPKTIDIDLSKPLPDKAVKAKKQMDEAPLVGKPQPAKVRGISIE